MALGLVLNSAATSGTVITGEIVADDAIPMAVLWLGPWGVGVRRPIVISNPMSLDEATEHSLDRHNLVVFGIVTYVDIFETQHQTWFCRRLEPHTPRTILSLQDRGLVPYDLCPFANSVDSTPAPSSPIIESAALRAAKKRPILETRAQPWRVGKCVMISLRSRVSSSKSGYIKKSPWRPVILTSVAIASYCSPPIDASTIIVLSKGKKVYIAADSLRVLGRDTDTPRHEQTCKILEFGATVVAVAGLVRVDSAELVEQPFSAHATIRNVLADPQLTTADAQATRIAESLAMETRAIAYKALEIDNSVFKMLFPRNEFIQLVVATVEKKTVHVSLRTLTARIVNGTPTIDVSAPVYNAKAINTLGSSSAIRAASKPTLGRILAMDAPKAVAELVKLQINSTPEDVGPPVNVMEVGPKGLSWIEPKGPCLEKGK
jgi:hypothetical protein